MDNFGFLKVAAAVPHVRVADCDYNTRRIAAMAEEAAWRGRRDRRVSRTGRHGLTPAATCCCSRRCSTPAADEALERLGAPRANSR